jgi:hypothetical protein
MAGVTAADSATVADIQSDRSPRNYKVRLARARMTMEHAFDAIQLHAKGNGDFL